MLSMRSSAQAKRGGLFEHGQYKMERMLWISSTNGPQFENQDNSKMKFKRNRPSN
jgi:hypothetical protein